jgi:hypothetical protein
MKVAMAPDIPTGKPGIVRVMVSTLRIGMRI